MATYKIELEGTLEDCLAAKIKNLRNLREWTQEDLCDRVSLSRASISNIEVGRHKVTINMLEELCQVFEIPSSELLPF